MINAWDLPEAADGHTPSPMTMEFQLRRLNRIAGALWELRPQIGEGPGTRMSIDLDSDYSQIHLSVADGAGRAVAEQLAGRLGWDVEADVRRVGMTKQHWWHGMAGGFRAQLVWVEYPPQIAVDASGFSVVDAHKEFRPSVDYAGPTRPVTPVPPMHNDLAGLGYEL